MKKFNFLQGFKIYELELNCSLTCKLRCIFAKSKHINTLGKDGLIQLNYLILIREQKPSRIYYRRKHFGWDLSLARNCFRCLMFMTLNKARKSLLNPKIP